MKKTRVAVIGSPGAYSILDRHDDLYKVTFLKELVHPLNGSETLVAAKKLADEVELVVIHGGEEISDIEMIFLGMVYSKNTALIHGIKMGVLGKAVCHRTFWNIDEYENWVGGYADCRA